MNLSLKPSLNPALLAGLAAASLHCHLLWQLLQKSPKRTKEELELPLLYLQGFPGVVRALWDLGAANSRACHGCLNSLNETLVESLSLISKEMIFLPAQISTQRKTEVEKTPMCCKEVPRSSPNKHFVKHGKAKHRFRNSEWHLPLKKCW